MEQASRGNVMIEFALVLWVVAILTLGGLEVGRALNAQQMAAVLSKEAARKAYRECSTVATVFEPGEEMPAALQQYFSSCLANNHGLRNIRTFAENLAPGTAVTISIYAVPPGTTTAALMAQDGTNTRFTPSESFKTLVQQHHTVIVSEVFVPFVPMLERLSMFYLNLRRDAFYDATII